MTLDNLSIRLGMHHGLYIGACIGVILTSLIVLFECCVLNGGITHILAASLALICAGLLVIGFICLLENKEFSMSDLACTCRYRRSIDPICRKCAFSSLNQKNCEDTPNNKG
ncbi:hypothetical protein [Methanospirillum hungatei]|uniref:hypothetical protein n=1 Tax=Methanospirillum hungatei TaxID=2203 RepID=UPI002C1DB87F|nr:hypothetical protein [Methanospirillum hungatei]HOW04538.1 hypothetical protein [Methanospirillum hungatei]